MKIGMKYPGIYYENWNEISQAIHMKIGMKYPRHSYENRNEISQAFI
jgi:hypothetical protein